MNDETSTAEASEPRIKLTREAADFVIDRLEKEGRTGAALRVGVKGGGCNGLIYVFEYTDEPARKRDLVYDFHGIKVLVDDRSIDFIEGSEIYYENTIMFQGLRFRNPLESTTCGCGETFSVKPEVFERRKARKLRSV